MNDTTRDPQAPSAYPWFIAFVCMFTLFLSNGMTATGITIFDPSLLDEFGWSRGDFKLRDLLNFVMVALFSPIFGILIDRWNPKYLLMVGCGLLSLGYFGYSLIANGAPVPLIEAIAVAARVEAKQAADNQADGGFVRDHHHVLAVVLQHNLADDWHGAGQDRDPRFAAGGGKDVGVFFPGRVLIGKLRFHIHPAQLFPAAVINLPQAVAQNGRQPVRPADDGRGFQGAFERAGIDGLDLVIRQALGQRFRLRATNVRKINVGRAGKTILGCQDRCAVTD